MKFLMNVGTNDKNWYAVFQFHEIMFSIVVTLTGELDLRTM